MVCLHLSASSSALLLLLFPVNVFAFRARSQSESAMQPVNIDLADIHRHGSSMWYVIKDGKTVKQNIYGKYTSAKPLNLAWRQIDTWNRRYDKDGNKTRTLIKVRLNGSRGAVIKTDLALRYQYGGRVKSFVRPGMENKGRFLRKIRVAPSGTYVSSNYKLDVRVTGVVVSRTGSKADPVAKAKLKFRIVYGKRGSLFSTFYKKEYEVTVLGTGKSSVRKLSSEGR